LPFVIRITARTSFGQGAAALGRILSV